MGPENRRGKGSMGCKDVREGGATVEEGGGV